MSEDIAKLFTFKKGGVDYEFFGNEDKDALRLEILRRIKDSGNINIIIRPQAYDVDGLPLNGKISAIFVEWGQHGKLQEILALFVGAIKAAEQQGVRIKYHN